MSESTLSLTFEQIATEIAKLCSLDTTNDAADILTMMNRGLRQFYVPPPLEDEKEAHRWTFLNPVTTLTTTTPYTTGTVAVASGIVTLTTGTFPSWAASAEITIGGTTYTVNTRDSGTQVTLTDLTVTVSAGATYSIAQVVYTAPDNFGGTNGPFTFASGTGYSPIKVVGEGEIRARRAAYNGNYSAPPRMVAVRPATTPVTGQRFQFLFWPTPDAVYILTYPYTILIGKIATGEYPLGGMAHSETVLASCLHIAAQRVGDQELRMRRAGEWKDRLRASVLLDRQSMQADHVGYNGSGYGWDGDSGQLGIVHHTLQPVNVVGLS